MALNKVYLSQEAREFLHFPVSGLPTVVGTLYVRFTPTGPWQPCEWDVSTGSSRNGLILVAGPLAPAGTAVVLPVGTYYPQVQLTEDPEIIVRSAPSVIIVQ